MCESTVFIEETDGTHEVMKDVTRIVMDGQNAICTNIIGEKTVLTNVTFKEANMLSDGMVFRRL